MEVFLLLLDELDDMAGAMRILWRPIFSFLTASVLFFATGYWLLHVPFIGLGLLATFLLLLFTMHARREYYRVLHAVSDLKR